MTQRRCVKAREAVKRKQCEVPAGEDSFHHRVRRECMVATTIAASAAEVARMRRIVPRAFELVERQERQQRRGRSKRARRAAERLASTNSGGGGNGAGQEPPAAAQPDGNKIEYGQVGSARGQNTRLLTSRGVTTRTRRGGGDNAGMACALPVYIF